MSEKKITLTTADGEMDAFLAAPNGNGSAPALIVIQEAFGVNEDIRDICRGLAAAGYLALAPEMFHRDGRSVEFGYSEFDKVMPAMGRLSNEGLNMDMKAAYDYLASSPLAEKSQIGIVGHCMGGFAAFLAACRLPVNAVVCFYGGGIVHHRPGIGFKPLLDEANRIRAPFLGFFGGKDQGIPQSDVDAIRAKLQECGVDQEIVVYPEAGHGFSCERRPSYHAEASKDSWRRMLAWLEIKMGKRH